MLELWSSVPWSGLYRSQMRKSSWSLLVPKSANKETANISMTSHKNRLIIIKTKDQKNEKSWVCLLTFRSVTKINTSSNNHCKLFKKQKKNINNNKAKKFYQHFTISFSPRKGIAFCVFYCFV